MIGMEKWMPSRSINNLNTFDELVSRFFDEPFFQGNGAQNWAPAADVVETEEQLKIHLDLPGMSKDNLNIELKDGKTLVIRGERKFEEQEKSKYHRVERFYGNFTRSFVLPATVDSTKISANFKDGVLEVVLPKSETAKARRIEIRG